MASNSAVGLLALLDEDDDALKLYALQQLDKSVHDFWFQISTSIASIEALYEDEEFSHRELAALVASKVRSAGRAVGGRWAGRADGRSFAERVVVARLHACATAALRVCGASRPSNCALSPRKCCRAAARNQPAAAPACPCR